MDRSISAILPKALLSAVIIGLIGVQTVASFGGLHRFRYWPFLSYPMYNQVHFRGEPLPRYSLVAIRDDGQETPVTAEDLRLDFWKYLRGPVRAAQHDDARTLLRQFQMYEHRAGCRVMAVRLVNHPVRLENGRLVALPEESQLIRVRNS
jgi:hypothetical protein